MDGYTKMSELASTDLKDVQTANILICYLLDKVNKPIDSEQLYDIAVSTEIINYFSYQDSIDYLIKNGSISVKEFDKRKIFTITDKGKACAVTLHDYVPKSYRDKIRISALKYFAKIKYESEIKIEYIKHESGGYYIHCRCLDVKCDIMDLKLYAPDLEQAKIIGNNIMKNPAGFYTKILKVALNNKEEVFNPDDL